MSQARRIASNTLALGLVQTVRMAVALGLTLYIAWRHGAVWLGKYALLLAYINIFQIVSEFGLPRLITRQVSRTPERARLYFWAALAIQGICAVAAMALMAIVVWLMRYPADTTRMLWWATLVLPLYAITAVAGAVLQGQERMGLLALAEGIGGLWQLVGTVVLLSLGYGIVTLAFVKIIAVALVGGILLGGLARHTSLRPRALDRPLARSLAWEARDLLILAVCGAILFRLDALVLAKLRGEEALGQYNAAYQLVKVLMLLTMAYADAIFPVLSRSFVAGQARFAQTINRSLRYGLVALIPIAASISLLSPIVIGLIYPSARYRMAAEALAWLAWVPLPYFVYLITTRALVAADRQRAARRAALILVGAAAIIQGGLTALWGVTGAAVATGLSFLLGAALNLGHAEPRARRQWLHQRWLRLAGVGLAMLGGMAWARTVHWALALWVGFLLYAGLTVSLRLIAQEDWHALRRLLGRREAAASPYQDLSVGSPK